MESLCYIPETDRTLSINDVLIKLKEIIVKKAHSVKSSFQQIITVECSSTGTPGGKFVSNLAQEILQKASLANQQNLNT